MERVVSKAVRVPKHDGERIRRLLIENQVLRTDLKIKKTERELIIPITKVSPMLESLSLINETFECQTPTIQSYKKIIQIPTNLKVLLPTAFDVIGDILLIKIPTELSKYKKEIGQALLSTQRQVHTVCSIDAVLGELRTRSVEVIAGIPKTHTMHREYGIQLYVDVAETYFSPRLAGERYRIASLVKDDEVIVDLFTGVAPFPLMIARHAHPKKIIAIDKNPVAVSFAKKNVMKNSALETIDVFEMDASNTASLLNKQGETADRVLMNLPFDSFRFLPIAFSIMGTEAVIHVYEIINEEKIEMRLKAIVERAEQEKVTIGTMTVHKIKTYAPHEFYIGIDITAQKNDSAYADVA